MTLSPEGNAVRVDVLTSFSTVVCHSLPYRKTKAQRSPGGCLMLGQRQAAGLRGCQDFVEVWRRSVCALPELAYADCAATAKKPAQRATQAAVAAGRSAPSARCRARLQSGHQPRLRRPPNGSAGRGKGVRGHFILFNAPFLRRRLVVSRPRGKVANCRT